MKKTFIVLIIIFISLFYSCGDKNPFATTRYQILIRNNSNKNISFFDSRVYPDTAMPLIKPYYGTSFSNGSSGIDSESKWETIIDNTPKDTLSIFITDFDTMVYKPWNEIRTQYRILKRYDLSLQDLQNKDWTITYP
jgi:hypothetical protein